MSFTGEQARCGVQSDPSRAGDERLGPGVKVCEVGFGAVGFTLKPLVRRELDEIARHKPRRDAHMS